MTTDGDEYTVEKLDSSLGYELKNKKDGSKKTVVKESVYPAKLLK
jgi:hypothetical protein